jgi:predicted ATPase
LVVLATSREPLGAPGEVVWGVAPLSLPAADASTPGDLTSPTAGAHRVMMVDQLHSERVIRVLDEVNRAVGG